MKEAHSEDVIDLEGSCKAGVQVWDTMSDINIDLGDSPKSGQSTWTCFYRLKGELFLFVFIETNIGGCQSFVRHVSAKSSKQLF